MDTLVLAFSTLGRGGALWAAEAAIYQRFGFGLATMSLNLEAETSAVGFARNWPREGTFRILPAGEAFRIRGDTFSRGNS